MSEKPLTMRLLLTETQSVPLLDWGETHILTETEIVSMHVQRASNT